jgi:PPM family protein phosphatase
VLIGSKPFLSLPGRDPINEAAMNSSGSFDLGDFDPPSLKARFPPEPLSSLVMVDSAGLSHPGLVRTDNEDHFFVARFGRFLEVQQSNLPVDAFPARSEEVGWAMAVADGLGGAAAGQEASRLAVTGLLNLVLHTPDWVLRLDDGVMPKEVLLRASERYIQVNQRLVEQALEIPGLSGFGTTLTCAYSVGHDLFVSHVGDSRAYLLRDGVLRQLSSDHTLVQSLVDQAIIDPKEAATHHLRHVLTRALGDTGADVQAEVIQTKLIDGDAVLLSTDGLTAVVSDDEILQVLAQGDDAAASCRRLLDLALGAGGPDNISVAVARYRFP